MDRQLCEFDTQDIRIAVVMSGGVSLAVWTSGVTIELSHLAQARAEPSPAVEYREILDLLRATATIDVVAGTSAGGLNGAFLALALAKGRKLERLRELWRDRGGLDDLLRDPMQRGARSLMRGDYFTDVITGGLRDLAANGTPVALHGAGQDAEHAAAPLELILTGTLWHGRSSTFTDDLGTSLSEVDHDATFRFSTTELPAAPEGAPACGDLTDPGVVEQLAAAARCTSSFPGAFEPRWVSVHPEESGVDNRYASDAGRADFRRSQFVVDGGVLLNRPLRPALDAIYRQPADVQVRRLLAYVVPNPAEAPAYDDHRDGGSTGVPDARSVLLDVVTRMRDTDSVSAELGEIAERNSAVAARRRARASLAAALATPGGDGFADRTWQGYRQVRTDHAVRTIARYLARGQDGSSGGWTEGELVDALREHDLWFVPRDATLDEALRRTGEEWPWGQSTVYRLGEMVIDVLKRAVWLADPGSEPKRVIVDCRRSIHATLRRIRAEAATLREYWLTAPRGDSRYGIARIPERIGRRDTTATNQDQLHGWLDRLLDGADTDVAEHVGQVISTRDRRRQLYDQAQHLADHLYGCATAIMRVCERGNDTVDPDGVEREHLNSLARYVLEGSGSAGEVLRRLLRLHVAQAAVGDAMADVDQEVELAQVAAEHGDCVTGTQAHHFGAFYRGTWRVNDWIHGRLDAVHHMVRLLLSPERIRQLGDAGPALADIRRLAVGQEGQGNPDRDWLDGRWQAEAAECERELAALGTVSGTPRALPCCAVRIAERIQTRILREELHALAVAIRAEADVPESSTAWLTCYDAAAATAGPGGIPAGELWELWELAKQRIGSQRIGDEVGADTFARTAARAAAVATNVVGSPTRPKPVATVLAGFRGYALAVWTLVRFLTTGSSFGTRVVDMALVAGGLLLAVTLVVPGIPLGLTLAGVALISIAFTAAALFDSGTDTGRRALGWRFLTLAAIALAALAGYLAWDIAAHGWRGSAWTLVLKVAVAVAIVLAGVWVARAQRR
ncbi:patatin-like protein [Haloechinothrix sp. LS1_15]|uniref:patatin-like protein n=1 Tax=Haloechinothrix sp. LS1_15 TaxID=2652248 RepID=UPI002944DAAF|nr:patatin-like protein [Haloechinothrix sp. LS1_15]MDV6011454.1 patatin-like protein [Haloechinothrix sp. LS1_15]